MSPRLFFLLALMLAGGYLLLSPQARLQKVPPKAADWALARLDSSTAAASAILLETPLEAIKAGSYVQTQTLLDLHADARPPRDYRELTVDALVKAMDGALETVPNSLPNLPLMPSLVRDILKNDPGGIRFGALPSNVYGQFDFSDPARPSITLSLELQRLHRDGVPTPLLAAVLVHELDHFLTYMLRSQPRSRNGNEYTAFRSQGLYVSALARLFHRKDADAVDAGDYDPEKKRYYEELKRIRERLFSGHLAQMIDDVYGPDPAPAPSAAPARQKK